jgi:hypothetical protein
MFMKSIQKIIYIYIYTIYNPISHLWHPVSESRGNRVHTPTTPDGIAERSPIRRGEGWKVGGSGLEMARRIRWGNQRLRDETGWIAFRHSNNDSRQPI